MAAFRRRLPLRFQPLEDRLTPAVAMLPDLVPDPSNLSGWTVSTVGGVTELAYATGMQNLGKGAFELRGSSTIITNGDGSQSQIVHQRIYNDDLTFADTQAGAFIYHPTHGHVHYDDFAVGTIRTRPTANPADGVIVATGPKTSFCLLDLSRNHPELPGSPVSGVYNTCSSQVQGISVGWKDIYSSGLDGQQIDITGLPNGDYWLEVVADPMNHVQETVETNNTTRIAISLTSQPSVGLRVLTSTPLGASNTAVDHIDLNFNMPVNAGTFTAADVALNGPNGPINVTGITTVSANSYRIDFASQTKVGTYTAIIGPNIAGTDGKLLNQDNDANYGEATDDVYTNVFTVTAPRVQGHTPAGGATTAVSTIRLQYNKPIDNATVTFASILSFTGPGGGNLMGQVSGMVPVTAGASALWDVNFTSMTGLGTYTLVIAPTMSDTLGNLVDQNGDLLNNDADRYTATFTITPAGIAGPDAFGYTALSSTYENLSAVTGWTTIIDNADDANAVVNLGTNTFNLYGTTYTGASSVYVNTNGLITFGAGSSSYTNGDLSSITYNSTTIYNPALAVLWDDWVKGPGTPQVRGLLQDTTGDAIPDRYLVQWNQVYPYNTSSSGMTITAILQLNTGTTPGNVTYNYADLDAGNVNFNNGASATVGLRANGNGATKLLVSQNSGSNALINTGKSLTISVPKVASITRMDPNPSPAGEVEFLVTFTEGVTGVIPENFSVTTTGNIAGAEVEHIHATADPKVYEVHVMTGTGTGTLKMNFVDDDSVISLLGAKVGGTGLGNGTFTASEIYNLTQPAPEVFGINIGDGTAQRSMIKQVQVVFDWPVTFAGNPANAFTLTGPNGPIALAVDLSNSSPQQTVALLTFSGAGTHAGSLRDGIHTLTALSGQISTGGVALAAGGPGGNYVTTVGRLYGDASGDGSVSGDDLVIFGNAFNTNSLALDFNGDTTLDGSDLAEFGNRFGMSL